LLPKGEFAQTGGAVVAVGAVAFCCEVSMSAHAKYYHFSDFDRERSYPW
jgi:hypothetical protein